MKHYCFILIACALALSRPAVAQDSVLVNHKRQTTRTEPPAVQAQAEALAKVYKAKDGEEKEQAYQELLSEHPVASSGKGDKMHNYARQAVAMGYIRQDNIPKAIQ